jgi:hypothetical protein
MDVTTGHPTDIPYANTSGTEISASCFYYGFNKWLTFRQPTDLTYALLSLNDNGQTLGVVTAKLYRDATEPMIKNINDASNGGNGNCFDYPMTAMKRHFVLTTQNQPTTSVKVRLYFSASELDDLAAASVATYSVPCDSADDVPPGSQASEMPYIHVTKYHGASENGVYSDNQTIAQGGIYKLFGPNAAAPLDASVANGFKDIFSGSNTAGGHNYVEFTVNDLSEFWLGGVAPDGAALPVTMLFLEAEAMNNTFIQVRWATALEINNKGFSVERSTDAQNWTEIAWVDGHGNSTERNDYHLDDYNVTPGIRYYYRLKQVDFDLQFEYTGIVSAIINASITFSIKDFVPNPTMDNTTLVVLASKEQEIKVDMYDIIGRRVISTIHQLHKGGNQIEFSLGNLASGTYTAVVSSANEIYTKKLVITR